MSTNADTPEAAAAPEWAPISEAAALVGVPVRSVYR
jgi:hypothetical protein